MKYLYILVLILNLISRNESNKSYDSYPSVLYVWSGQNTSVENAADFVAVIDFDENSHSYGQIIERVSLVSNATDGIGQAGNEPHHSGISLNGKYYITGGLLSFLSKNKEVFVWSIPDNVKKGPKFLYGLNVSGACPDEFLAINETEFLLTMMCSESATSPGDIVSINAKTGFTKSILKNASSLTYFNPHGFGRLSNGSIFVADYIDPITLTGNDPSKIKFRNTSRHFFPDGTLQRIFEFEVPTTPGSTTGLGQGIGFMELKTIPGDTFGRGYTCGTNVNSMYLIGAGMEKPILAFDGSVVNGYIKEPSAGIISIFPDGKHLLMSLQMRFIILLNITNTATPTILRVFDFCSDLELSDVYIQSPNSYENTTFYQFCAENNNRTGSHALMHPQGENRFIVINYFLNFGLAKFPGTRSVHTFKLNDQLTDFHYDKKFNPNFQFDKKSKRKIETFHSLKAFPHHVQYLKLKNQDN